MLYSVRSYYIIPKFGAYMKKINFDKWETDCVEKLHTQFSQRGRGNFTYLLEGRINFALKLSVGCLIPQF